MSQILSSFVEESLQQSSDANPKKVKELLEIQAFLIFVKSVFISKLHFVCPASNYYCVGYCVHSACSNNSQWMWSSIAVSYTAKTEVLL